MAIDPINRAESKRQGGAVASRQSTAAYTDYRDVDPHQFLQEAYDGNGGFSGKTDITSYLIANASENFYKTRCAMSIYLNHFKKFIDAQWKPIFKHEIKTYVQTPEGNMVDEHLYLDFCENVTGSGLNKIDFQKILNKSAFIHDVSFAIMDMAEGDVEPFLYHKTIMQLVKYTTDEKGALTACLFDDGKKNGTYYRRYIGLDKWALLASDKGTDDSFVVVYEAPNNLGILPVYPFFTQRPDDIDNYKPFPSHYDIASVGCYLYDKGSKLDYVIDKQAHSILAIQGNIDAVPNGVDNALVISESERSIFQPQFLSPPADLPRLHAERIAEVTAQMYDLMSDSGVSVQTAQIGTESGIAKSYTFNATNTNLKHTVTLQTKFDKWLYETYKVFMGDTGEWTSYSEYPVDFTPVPRLSVDEMLRLVDFYTAEGLSENKIDALRRLRLTIDPMATVKDEKALIDEIELKNRAID